MAATKMDVNTNSKDDEVESRDTGAAEAPAEVTISRKRKKVQIESMETDTAIKKPSFPPVAVEEGVKYFLDCLVTIFSHDLLCLDLVRDFYLIMSN